MYEFEVHVERASESRCEWYLDFCTVMVATEKKATISLVGWIFSRSGNQVESLEIRSGKSAKIFALNRARPDVLSAFSTAPDDKKIPLKCGFRVEFEIIDLEFEIGINSLGIYERAASLKLSNPGLVIGRTGWLFLDQDTNGSVDQYRGLKKVEASWEDQWRDYFFNVDSYFENKCKHVFLLAPSKEEVLSHEYPWVRNDINLVDKLLADNPKKISWPIDLLREYRYLSYDVAETHWNDFGANLGLTWSLGQIEEKHAAVEGLNYKVVSEHGDLGDRLPASIKSKRLVTVPSRTASLIEDNGVVNHGNFRRYTNPKAVSEKKLMIFGGSSANKFIAAANYLYKEVIFVHSTASVDRSLVERHRPDVVILQTNQRFIVDPPAPFVDITKFSL